MLSEFGALGPAGAGPPGRPLEYDVLDFERLDWVEAAVDSGLEVVLTLSPNGAKRRTVPEHMNRVFGPEPRCVEMPWSTSRRHRRSVREIRPAQTIPTTR